MQDDKNTDDSKKKKYEFGGLKEYDLEKIESEILEESVYLDVFAGSDSIFKENCEKLNSEEIYKKFTTLQAYSFKYKTKEFPVHSFPRDVQFGFMAQEIESIFPHLVKKDGDGNRHVNYTQVIPLMAETIKVLSEKIDLLEKRITDISKNK